MASSMNHSKWVGLFLLWLGLIFSTLAFAAEASDAQRSSDRKKAGKRTRIGHAPDPEAIRSADQWVLTFRYKHGKVEFIRSQRVRLRRVVATPRRMGRYAIELLSGPTVIERVRFDFPLLGADELAGKRRPYNSPPRFETKATVVHRVMLPNTSRASRVRLVDRATGQSFMIAWPPTSASKAVKKRNRHKRNDEIRRSDVSKLDASSERIESDARQCDAKRSDAQPSDAGRSDTRWADAGRHDAGRNDTRWTDAIALEAGQTRR